MTAIMGDLDWQAKAACEGMNLNSFFPDMDFLVEPEVLIACGRCPVKENCLNWAMEHGEEFGVWGGMTEEQRRKIGNKQTRVRCPDCRSDRVMKQSNHEVCISCGLSWPA